jgi:chromatin modification-related protein EAF6
MTENAPAAASASASSATGANGAGGPNEAFDRKKEMAEYEAEKKIIKDAIAKRAKILAELSHLENKIADLEGRYLESTPGGNILTGFDNYTKGLTGAAAQRRKVGNAEQNRVFSRSSISYNALNVCGTRGMLLPCCAGCVLLG